jgi:hypothetical protein
MGNIYIKVIGWLWLLFAMFWLVLLGLSVRAMFASPTSRTFQQSEWSPLVAALSFLFMSLFALSGLAFVFRWRFHWWWQIPATLSLVATCYLFWVSGVTQ